jgi:hypothetical protein
MKRLIFLFLTFSSVVFAQITSLHDSDNQYDYIIITIDEFVESCNFFTSHKENYNGFKALITTKSDIVKEFNAHSDLQENIRDFISYTGNNWKEPKPKYFLIAADVDSIPNFKFQSVNFSDYKDTSYSDYYYSVDTSDTDSTTVSYSVGRVAARNNTELENYFNKVITYEMNSEIQDWHSRALFVSDDEYGADSTQYNGDMFARIAFDLAAELLEFITKDFVIPIDTSNYYGQKDSIIAKLERGQSSVVLSGHANNELFTHDSMFMESDIGKINNIDMPFFISMFGKQEFGRATIKSIVNSAIVSENGAIGSISYVGVHFVTQGSNIFNKIWKDLYSGLSIGDIYIKSVNNSNILEEIRKLNIFGDPSIILKNDFSTGINESESFIPKKHYLAQNYPNPFNPTTTIKYTIGSTDKSDIQNVELTVYDVLGRKIRTLVKENQSPGNYEIVFDAHNLSSGIYFYTLNINSFVQTKKMILLQ